MCLRLVFLLITRLAAGLRLSWREETWKSAEILILRHQLAVLQRRQSRHPKLNWADRALLAVLLGVIPKARRHGLRLVVTPGLWSGRRRAGDHQHPRPSPTVKLDDALNIHAGEQLLVHGAGGVTGGLLVALALARGAQVIATAGPASQQRVAALGARQVIDYHDKDWPSQVRALTKSHGVDAAANAAPGGAASALEAVADGGRLATITSDPPSQQRGITISSIIVRADGNQLRNLASLFGGGQLAIPVAASYRLADAAQALAQATGGHAAGAIVLTP